jgi:hypothetical protein
MRVPILNLVAGGVEGVLSAKFNGTVGRASHHDTVITIARLIVDDSSHHKDFSKGHFSYKTHRNVKWEKQFQSDC